MNLFALELQRRFTRTDTDAKSFAAHPGTASTNLSRHLSVPDFVLNLIQTSSAQGALPTLYAATDPEAIGGAYYGPDGFLERAGYPELATLPSVAKDRQTARRLWATAEELTGVQYLSRDTEATDVPGHAET